MSWLVLCPYVHEPTFAAMWETMHPDLQARAVVVDNTVTNRGAAASRNIGARRLLERGDDWMIDVSPVTRFGPAGGRDFVDQVLGLDGWVVQSAAPVNWHLIAWHRDLHVTVGLWDENFHPIYWEDADMSRRVHVHAREAQVAHDGDRPATWHCVNVDAWVTMYGHSIRVGGVHVDHERLRRYYEQKWGGPSGREAHLRPFGLDVGLDWWPEPGLPLAMGDDL